MRLSDFIKGLQAIKEKRGDLQFFVRGSGNPNISQFYKPGTLGKMINLIDVWKNEFGTDSDIPDSIRLKYEPSSDSIEWEEARTVGKRRQVIGTTEEAISATENKIGFKFSPSYRLWLLQFNGLQLPDVQFTYYVDDKHSVRNDSGTIVNQRLEWESLFDELASNFTAEDLIHRKNLLPFAHTDLASTYCFDYNEKRDDGEVPVILRDKFDDIAYLASSFAEFVENYESDDLDDEDDESDDESDED